MGDDTVGTMAVIPLTRFHTHEQMRVMLFLPKAFQAHPDTARHTADCEYWL